MAIVSQLCISFFYLLHELCEDYLTCDIDFNAVMPLSRASTRGRYRRIEGVIVPQDGRNGPPTVETGVLLIERGVAVTPSMRLYLPRVEARLRGIIALKAYVASQAIITNIPCNIDNKRDNIVGLHSPRQSST